MARAESRRYAARRSIRTWQLAVMVGAVGALAAAGCSSSSTTTSGTAGGSATAPAGGTSSAPGNATSGSINWWASPITTSAKYGDTRTALIAAFQKQYPNIHVSLTSAPT